MKIKHSKLLGLFVLRNAFIFLVLLLICCDSGIDTRNNVLYRTDLEQKKKKYEQILEAQKKGCDLECINGKICMWYRFEPLPFQYFKEFLNKNEPVPKETMVKGCFYPCFKNSDCPTGDRCNCHSEIYHKDCDEGYSYTPYQACTQGSISIDKQKLHSIFKSEKETKDNN